jgi:hypothetical protein
VRLDFKQIGAVLLPHWPGEDGNAFLTGRDGEEEIKQHMVNVWSRALSMVAEDSA